tara:strand:+ start:12812 stop:12952 length:141 start_codon:yes stop_codon:yes gene_type:complete
MVTKFNKTKKLNKLKKINIIFRGFTPVVLTCNTLQGYLMGDKSLLS